MTLTGTNNFSADSVLELASQEGACFNEYMDIIFLSASVLLFSFWKLKERFSVPVNQNRASALKLWGFLYSLVEFVEIIFSVFIEPAGKVCMASISQMFDGHEYQSTSKINLFFNLLLFRLWQPKWREHEHRQQHWAVPSWGCAKIRCQNFNTEPTRFETFFGWRNCNIS